MAVSGNVQSQYVANTSVFSNANSTHGGYLLIGSDKTPLSLLHLDYYHDVNLPRREVAFQMTDNFTGYSNTDGFKITLDSNVLFNQQEYAGLVFLTDTTERMRISKDGFVGIGIDNPHEKLEINGNVKIGQNALIFKDVNHGIAYKEEFAGKEIGGPVVYGWSGGALGTMQNGTEKNILVWKENGRVGIGTDDPTQALDVNGKIIKTYNKKALQGINTYTINTSKLDKGVYFVKITATENIQVFKIIKSIE